MGESGKRKYMSEREKRTRRSKGERKRRVEK